MNNFQKTKLNKNQQAQLKGGLRKRPGRAK